MANLETSFCNIKSPNPFWLASAPPTNTGEQVMRAFDAGWGGAVWKTLGDPIVNVTSRFGAIDYLGTKMMGLNNIELITDRPLKVNLDEIREVKKRFPKNVIIASLMTETKNDWKVLIQKCEDAGVDGLELNFGCPHGMCERGMGSSVGQEPKLLEEITRWTKEFAKTPVLVKLTPNTGDIVEAGQAAVAGGADGISLINTIKSIIGVDLDRMIPVPRVADGSSNGGYCGPAVKPIALHMVAALARDPIAGRVPISGIGGISTWRDAAEFIALGAANVQVCTAVMHHGYRIVKDMIEGLSDFLDHHGMKSVAELRGRAVSSYKEWGELDLNYKLVAKIDPQTCIGCQLCVTACNDGAHQCIFTGSEDRTRPPHAHASGKAIAPKPLPIGKLAGDRVPWIDEPECVGCNLCQLVCPVQGCITMEEARTGPKETWNDRVAQGRDKVPGGIHD
jgi:dihydropyrimidine dehydrogenase (NAD+) subunit PreA